MTSLAKSKDRPHGLTKDTFLMYEFIRMKKVQCEIFETGIIQQTSRHVICVCSHYVILNPVILTKMLNKCLLKWTATINGRSITLLCSWSWSLSSFRSLKLEICDEIWILSLHLFFQMTASIFDFHLCHGSEIHVLFSVPIEKVHSLFLFKIFLL